MMRRRRRSRGGPDHVTTPRPPLGAPIEGCPMRPRPPMPSPRRSGADPRAEREGVAGPARVVPRNGRAVPRLDPQGGGPHPVASGRGDPEVLEELDPHDAAAILRRCHASRLQSLAEMDLTTPRRRRDDRPRKSQILVRMDPRRRRSGARDLQPDTAGGTGDAEFVAVAADATTDGAIAAIRASPPGRDRGLRPCRRRGTAPDGRAVALPPDAQRGTTPSPT